MRGHISRMSLRKALRLLYRARLSLALLPLLLWVLIAEFGLVYFYSPRWHWPSSSAVLSSPTIRQCLKMNDSSSSPCYDPQRDVFYFPEPSNASSTFRRGSSSDLKMLILSDPHIMCTYDDEPWIARWDADRYLQRSFSYLMFSLHPQPDVIVLLGDVFSNGFVATDQQWEDYLNCLRRVYPVPSSIKLIAVMGDNDIGGEGHDLMTDVAIKRYVAKFGPLNEIIHHKGRHILKLTTVCYINAHPRSSSETQCRHEMEDFIERSLITAQPRPDVVLSHVPLDDLSPNIKSKLTSSLVGTRFVFSGHIHHQKYSSHSTAAHMSTSQVKNHEQLNVDNANSRSRVIHEITVPTCSYRMGEKYMGVGAAVLTESGGLLYRVLWLPPRYPVLISYTLLLVLTVLFIVSYLFSFKFLSPMCLR